MNFSFISPLHAIFICMSRSSFDNILSLPYINVDET